MVGWTVASIIVSVISIVYSVYSSMEAARKARAARREAEARADAAKGFQVPAEAVAKPLPVYFGRNLAGGVRVYHNTFNAYTFAAAGANSKVFDPGSNMGGSLGGEKHEYLAIQQVLSCGDLNRVISVDVDQMAYTTEEYKHGMRLHVYTKGGSADPLMTAIDPERVLAKFPGMPFLTGVFRLNRDNPQYNGVPAVQVYVEGTPVENVALVGGIYTVTTPTYSNNPARCLLHYMINTKYGRGAPLNTLDLKSFYDAIKICDRLVVTNANKDGRYWTSSVVAAEQRDLKIYECNMAIDTGKKIRENIEDILSTMPGSELIWSNGYYSLQLLCPFIYKSAVTYELDDVVQLSDGRVFKSTMSGNNPAAGPNGWTVYAGTLTKDYGYSILNANVADTQLIKTGLSMSGSNNIVRLTLKRVSGTGDWEGICFYSTANHSYSASFYKVVAAPADMSDFITVEWDMAALTFGGTDWTTSTITAIRFDLTNGTGNVYHVKKLSCGAYINGGFVEGYSSDITCWTQNYLEVTDDDIIIEKGIETSQPNAQTRLNSATVSFLNEAKDFTEDAVSWPSKLSYIEPHNLYLGVWESARVYQKGDIVYHQALYYQLSTGVNRQNVNAPNNDTTWKVCPTPSQKIGKGVWNAALAYTTGDMVTYLGNTYQLTDGIVRVNDAAPSIDIAWHLMTDNVYATLRAADSQMSLESTAFGKGVVSFYNAMAMAEQTVRESRSSVIYKLTVKRSFMSLTPGDLLLINSTILNIPGEMTRVFAVEVQPTGDITISAMKFDAATFAWNVADTEIVAPRNVFNNKLTQPTNLVMDIASQRVFPETIATLTWDRPSDIRVSSFLVKYTLDVVPTVSSTWAVIGRTSVGKIEIPFINGLHATFAVISETANGRMDNWSTWPYLRYDTATIPFSNISGLGYEVLNDGILLKISKSYSNLALSYEVRRAVLNAATPGWDDVTNVPVEIISGNSVKVEFLPIGTTKFLVKVRTRDNISGGTMETLAITVTAPAAPAVTTQVIDNNVLFYWTDSVSQQPIDTYELRKGSDYATAQVIGTKSGLFTSIFETQAGNYDYWIVAIDKGGNYGTPTKTTVRVAQPPDYNMVRNTPSVFASTTNQFVMFTNAAASELLVLPVNTTETVQTHFDENLLQNSQNMINGGGWEDVSSVFTSLPCPIGDPAAVVGTAVKLTKTAVTDAVFARQVYAHSSGTTYTASVWVYIPSGQTGVTNWSFAADWQDGEIGAFTANSTTFNTWVKISCTKTLTSARSFVDFNMHVNGGNAPTGFYFYAWGAQEVVGTTAAPYFWESPDALIAAGNTYMLQPVPTTGEYQEILDFGPGFDATLAIIKVTATMTILEQVAGCTYQMYVSKSVDNITYSTELASDTIFASGFRYIKFRLVVTSDTKGFMRISGIRYNADTKLKNESGMITCNAADAGGTTVTFNTAFFDVASIDVTARGTTPITAMYDFVDAPNPTSFKILLFNSAGARVSGPASYSIKGY